LHTKNNPQNINNKSAPFFIRLVLESKFPFFRGSHFSFKLTFMQEAEGFGILTIKVEIEK